ncbi:MAG: YggS family pyridoxal phosphate-dependent enzyme [Acutalibacteraceae bacterium]|nr:YggS family pyridoxal phosphate-dependent enzyme [Acutalibacteraceae bacterium]
MQEKLLSNQQKLNDINYNYHKIEEEIAKAAQSSGRTREDITFLAATKTVEPQYINYAISLGLKYIGENKVQELLSKYDEYNLNDCTLQFIGHLQSNKVRQIADKVNMIQSVDSLKLAQEIAKQSQKHNKAMDILLEVNIGDEESKSGTSINQVEELCCQISQLQGVNIKGLMTIPPICETTAQISRYFSDMYKLFIDIKGKKIDNVSMDILSMGMSSDYAEAIKCGANMVRIGSSLFGARIYK